MATPQTRLRELLPGARELGALLAARALADAVAWASGFRALSDDDYARISIAQRFAQAPSIDPSGTSWLPAPFWLYGAAFRGFGAGLSVARVTAILLGLGATVLVYIAARTLGTSRLAAVLAAVLSCCSVRYSTLLGLAAVPEVPCAALLLFAATALARPAPGLRAWGVLALFTACLSRYEAWPIAAIFACFCGRDALKQRRVGYALCALAALAGPVAWLALGHATHGDALFFVARVADYRRALGGDPTSIWQRLLEYPWLLLRGAPALFVALLLVALLSREHPPLPRLSAGRSLLALLGMLAFLMLGSVRDGVPTHHAGRVLLPIWFFGCIVAAQGLVACGAIASRRVSVCVACVVLLPIALLLVQRNDFLDRSLEIEAGQVAREYAARTLGGPAQAEPELLIDTPDYGFFAVQAGFGSPRRTSVVVDHDPRHPRPDPFHSAQTQDLWGHPQAAFVIATPEHCALLEERCAKVWQNARFALLRCAR